MDGSVDPVAVAHPLRDLTQSQRAAATSTAQNTLNLAGPGSGNTKTVVARAGYNWNKKYGGLGGSELRRFQCKLTVTGHWVSVVG